MNIIFDIKTNNLKTVKFSSDATYNLEDINFYIANGQGKYVYCNIKDEVISLQEMISENVNYQKYKISTKEPISIENGRYGLRVLYIGDTDAGISQAVDMNINVDSFNLVSKLSLITEISQDIQSKYNKILEMTQMNIEMYKEFAGGDK